MEIDKSLLLEAAESRSKAFMEYISAIRESRQKQKIRNSAAIESNQAKTEHEAALRDLFLYFDDNIVHAGIKFSKPEIGDWLELLIAGGKVSAYVRGEAEAGLLKGFRIRRGEVIKGLANEVESKRELMAETGTFLLDASMGELSTTKEVRINEIKSGLADLYRKIEYISFLMRRTKTRVADVLE